VAEDDFLDSSDQRQIVECEGDFKPLVLLSEWIEPKKMDRRLSMYVKLPSGVVCTGYSARVLEGGDFLDLSICGRSLLPTNNCFTASG